MLTNPEIRMAQKHKTYTKLSNLFKELDQAESDGAKDNIKREIRRIAADEGIQKISFPKKHRTDDDLKILKERIRKKLLK